MAYNLEKLTFGSFARFVESGTSVGTDPINIVGIDFMPDPVTATASWNSLGCVIDSTLEPDIEENDPDYCPSVTGGYNKETSSSVVQDILKLSLKTNFEIIYRLVFGLSAKIVDGVAQIPFSKKDRFVEGWMEFILKGGDGVDRATGYLYGRIRIDANPLWSKDPTKPAIRFEVIPSTISEITFEDVVTPAA